MVSLSHKTMIYKIIRYIIFIVFAFFCVSIIYKIMFAVSCWFFIRLIYKFTFISSSGWLYVIFIISFIIVIYSIIFNRIPSCILNIFSNIYKNFIPCHFKIFNPIIFFKYDITDKSQILLYAYILNYRILDG